MGSPHDSPNATASCATMTTSATARTITTEGASERDEPPRIEAIRRRQHREPHPVRAAWQRLAEWAMCGDHERRSARKHGELTYARQ